MPSHLRPVQEGAKRPHRVSVLGVIGELLVTAGVFIFLFLGWQLWLNDLLLGSEQRDEALELSQELGTASPAPSAEPGDPGEPEFGDPVISQTVPENAKFAIMYVPRFGADYARTVAQGVSASSVLKTGVGHYPDSQMPGEVGNFAVAAHRTTWGAPFNLIGNLQIGDKIYLQTADGWYTYVFRSLEYVLPTGVGVVAPVPQVPDAAPTDRLLTMTSCNPMLSAAERIVAYSVFDSWQPGSAGPPEALVPLVGTGA